MEPHRRRMQEEESDEDGWPLPPSAHSTPTRKQKYVDEWLSTQSASNLSIPYKNRSRNFSQSTRGSSCKSFRSNSSSRKLHRGLLKSALKKKQSSIYKQATSYLPSSSRARASISSASNQSFVIDSKYKSPTRKSAADRSSPYEKTVQFKSPSSAKSPRGSTGKCPCSLIRGGATPTGKDGSSSAGQDLMNQFVGNLLAPSGPLNVNSEIIKELAYALVKYYDEQDVIAAERAYGSPKELPKFDVSTDDLFDEEPASNQQRSRAFGTRLQPGPSTRVTSSWRNNNAALENIQPAGQSINYGTPRPRTFGSLLGKSPRPQTGNCRYQLSRRQ